MSNDDDDSTQLQEEQQTDQRNQAENSWGNVYPTENNRPSESKKDSATGEETNNSKNLSEDIIQRKKVSFSRIVSLVLELYQKRKTQKLFLRRWSWRI